MNKVMSIEAALAELQKPLNGRNAKTWAFGPAVRTLIAALEQAKSETKEFRHRLRNEQALLESADKRIDELENDEVRQRLANAEHQLHMAELAKHNLKASRRVQFRKRLAAERRVAELEASKLSTAASDVMSERQRQITAEGWTPESDDEYVSSEMAGAAACYAHHVNARGWVFKNRPDDYQSEIESSDWPWSPEWWKPTSPRRDLVKAGALIIAEIERIDRAAGGSVEGSE